jgi:hypothetical protein
MFFAVTFWNRVQPNGWTSKSTSAVFRCFSLICVESESIRFDSNCQISRLFTKVVLRWDLCATDRILWTFISGHCVSIHTNYSSESRGYWRSLHFLSVSPLPRRRPISVNGAAQTKSCPRYRNQTESAHYLTGQTQRGWIESRFMARLFDPGPKRALTVLRNHLDKFPPPSAAGWPI